MASPFPGVDPFIECQEWQDFHTTFNTVIREMLSPGLEPRYVVRVERRVYVEHANGEAGEPNSFRVPDATVLHASDEQDAQFESPGGVAAAIAPVECVIPVPEEQRETYLVVRERETMEVVTVVETLSPTNKRAGSDGRREYLTKRETVLKSASHLVELDLLRGGQRMPMVTPLPTGDFYAVISRVDRRPRVGVYAWTLQQALPTIPIPLMRGDADVSLNLQTVATTVYDRARYHLSVNYDKPLDPPLNETEAAWFLELRAGKGSASKT